MNKEEIRTRFDEIVSAIDEANKENPALAKQAKEELINAAVTAAFTVPPLFKARRAFKRGETLNAIYWLVMYAALTNNATLARIEKKLAK
jgi:hypothetical protein